MKKFVIVIVIVGLLGGGGYGAYRYFYLEKQKTEDGRVSSDSEDAVHVDKVADIIGLGSGNGLVDRYGGETVAQATLDVKLDSDRKVAECYVKEGDYVKTGAKLFQYDVREDEDKLAQAEIDIERSQSEIEQSKRAIEQYEKEKKTAQSDEQLAITTSILTEENSIKQKEYEIKSKEHEIESLKEGIKNSVVTAEMEGVIQKVNDSMGDDDSYSYGSDSDSAYITILETGDFRIKGTVNEQNIKNLSEGMSMIVFSRVDSEQKWYGTISEIDRESNEDDSQDSYMSYGTQGDSSNYRFYVELENSDGLMLGQHVYMEENVGQDKKKEGIWLESYYLIQEEDKNYVWKANSSNQMEKQEVELGDYDEEEMEYQIKAGLTEEDYIAYPMDGIEPGAPVVYNDMQNSGDEQQPEDVSYEENRMDGEEFPEMEEGGDDLDWEDGEAPEWNEGDDLNWDENDEIDWGDDAEADDVYVDSDDDGDAEADDGYAASDDDMDLEDGGDAFDLEDAVGYADADAIQEP